MTEIWTPSDELLLQDPKAAAQVEAAEESATVAEPDDAAANEANAAIAIAEVFGVDSAPGQDGNCPDDDALDDPDDTDPVGDDV